MPTTNTTRCACLACRVVERPLPFPAAYSSAGGPQLKRTFADTVRRSSTLVLQPRLGRASDRPVLSATGCQVIRESPEPRCGGQGRNHRSWVGLRLPIPCATALRLSIPRLPASIKGNFR